MIQPELVQYVRQHVVRGTCQCGKCVDRGPENIQPDGHTVDLMFFKVAAVGNPTPEELRSLILASKEGEFCSLDPFDGSEHNYMEVGAWIGSQELALQLMGLGSLLKLWDLITPATFGITGDEAMQLAGVGMVVIVKVP